MRNLVILLIGLFLFAWNLNPIQKKQDKLNTNYSYKSTIDQVLQNYSSILYFNDYPHGNLTINNISYPIETLSLIQYKESGELIVSLYQVINRITYISLKTKIGLDFMRSNSYFNVSLLNNTTKLGRT